MPLRETDHRHQAPPPAIELQGLRLGHLRPELQALFDRLAIDPHTELFVRPDGMVQSGPDPVSETIKNVVPAAATKRVA